MHFAVTAQSRVRSAPRARGAKQSAPRLPVHGANGSGIRQAGRATPGGLPPSRVPAQPLPGGLRRGLEAASGIEMADVRVHRDAPEPASVGALACARGRDVFLAPNQEHLLPHEAWHLVQQKEGRVQPTSLLPGGQTANTDRGLEQEADRMGAGAAKLGGQGARVAGAAARRVADPEGPLQGKLVTGSIRGTFHGELDAGEGTSGAPSSKSTPSDTPGVGGSTPSSVSPLLSFLQTGVQPFGDLRDRGVMMVLHPGLQDIYVELRTTGRPETGFQPLSVKQAKKALKWPAIRDEAQKISHEKYPGFDPYDNADRANRLVDKLGSFG